MHIIFVIHLRPYIRTVKRHPYHCYFTVQIAQPDYLVVAELELNVQIPRIDGIFSRILLLVQCGNSVVANIHQYNTECADRMASSDICDKEGCANKRLKSKSLQVIFQIDDWLGKPKLSSTEVLLPVYELQYGKLTKDSALGNLPLRRPGPLFTAP